jgi:hypothetical protein
MFARLMGKRRNGQGKEREIRANIFTTAKLNVGLIPGGQIAKRNDGVR